MKLFQLARILAFALLTLFAQNTFAGEPLKNGTTLKLALVIPQSDFGKYNSGIGLPDDNHIILQYQQRSASLGIAAQWGKMYFFASLNKDETMKLGLDVTWFGLAYQQVNIGVNNISFNSSYEVNMHHIVVYPEVGPSFSYSPTESMAIDFAFKLTPTFGLIGGNYTHYAENWIKGLGFGLRYTPALYFRYNIFLIGAEYSLGNLNFNYYSTGPYGASTSGTSPYSTLRIVLGFKF